MFIEHVINQTYSLIVFCENMLKFNPHKTQWFNISLVTCPWSHGS